MFIVKAFRSLHNSERSINFIWLIPQEKIGNRGTLIKTLTKAMNKLLEYKNENVAITFS